MALAELGPRNLNEDDVIRFLKHLKSPASLLGNGCKRYEVIMRFGSQQLHTDVQHLVPIEQRLDDYIRAQQNGGPGAEAATLEGVAGPIDPHEPWVIREWRASIRDLDQSIAKI